VGVSQKQIMVHDLEIGMFVSDLDRPWHQTPFPIQGFYIRSQSDIRALHSHCKWVKVDVAEARQKIDQEEGNVRLFSQRASGRGNGRNELKLPPLSIREPVSHQVTVPLRKEIKASRELLDDGEAALQKVFNSIRSAKAPDLRPVADLTRKMVSSVVRQPSALLWLSRTRHYDDFLYQHALNTAVCGRQLGLNEGLLNHLAMGCLLSQVGKTALPKDLVEREQQLSAEEYAQYRSYIERGAALLENSGLSRAVMTVVQNHRERHNGSGFPQGLKGDRIPLLAKVAGIAEFFESLITPRETRDSLTPAKAVSMLYEMRNIEFQDDLVEAFIKAIGVYPTGSLVELSDGQRGIVISHSPERRLWPSVMVMQDAGRQSRKTAKIIDLASYNESKSGEAMLSVKECLPHGAEGLDPAGYDVTGAESRWSLGKLLSR